MTRTLRTAQLLTAAWLLLLGGCAAVAVWVPPGAGRPAFGDIFQGLLPLLVNGALLMNAITPNRRKNAFWMLLALGCSLGLGGQVIWTYVEVYQHRVLPDPFIGDFVFFLRTLPMIAALTMQPHKQHDSRRTLFGYVDFSLLLCWWIYLYLLTVIPWQSIAIDDARYNQAYNVICTFENLVFVAGAIVLSAKGAGRVRRIYAHLAGKGWRGRLQQPQRNIYKRDPGDGGENLRKRAAQRSRLGVALGASGIAFASSPRHLVCENKPGAPGCARIPHSCYAYRRTAYGLPGLPAL